jgi:ATP-dependent RNA helicase RhlE
MKFTDLGLAPELLEAIAEQGYDQPSPIQEKAIPHVLDGRDVMAAAQTGTGKTAGFTLPILHYLANTPKPKGPGNQARVLVLTPTRELAAQIAASVETYGQFLKIKSAVVFGGVKINPQMQRLRGGVDVLIATPGRLLDLHSQNAVQFDKLEVLVLDEADRMLDMGFIHDIRRIIKMLPKKRQTLLFSATFSNDIRALAKTFLFEPIEVSVSAPNTTVDSVTQRLIAVEKSDKTAVLAQLIQDNDWFQVLVFSRTKHGANKLAKKLNNQNIEASAIHGNKSQGARTKALADFKLGKCRVLVATDIAARGIDIDQLPQVVNFDLPQVAEEYVHRIGRTGRAGSTGEAVSLVSHDEFKMLLDIERLIKKKIPRDVLPGYEPLNGLPESKDSRQNTGPRKPKKPKQGNRTRNRSNQSGAKSSGQKERSNNSSGEKAPAKPRNPNSRNRQRNRSRANKSGSSGQKNTPSKTS